MDKIKDFVNKNYKIVIGIIIGITISVGIGVSAVATKDITYDNSKSGLTSTNLQGVIDELNEKAKNLGTKCPDGYKCGKVNSNIVKAYTYNSTNCVTGEEPTCIERICYADKGPGSCPAGTIIKYKVNDSTTKYFHVLHDDGETMTLQHRENTVYNTAWYSTSNDNTKGPTTILPALESATSGWTNVNNQTYTTSSSCSIDSKSGVIGCGTNNTLGQRTGKARMITMQEAIALGCTTSSKCPNFMNNYLSDSTDYGGTVNDTHTENGTSSNTGYWTMASHSPYSPNASSCGAWYVGYSGVLGIIGSTTDTNYGARAVVVINK